MTVFNVFAAFVVALRAEVATELLPVATTRTTCNAFAYERKLVAVKKSSAVFALGFWNVLTRAVSWETKTQSGYPVWWDTPKNLNSYVGGKPDIHFSKDVEGVLPQSIKELMEMREYYKTLRADAKTEEEREKNS